MREGREERRRKGRNKVGRGRVGIAPATTECRTGEGKNGQGDMRGTSLPALVPAPAPALERRKCVASASLLSEGEVPSMYSSITAASIFRLDGLDWWQSLLSHLRAWALNGGMPLNKDQLSPLFLTTHLTELLLSSQAR